MVKSSPDHRGVGLHVYTQIIAAVVHISYKRYFTLLSKSIMKLIPSAMLIVIFFLLSPGPLFYSLVFDHQNMGHDARRVGVQQSV